MSKVTEIEGILNSPRLKWTIDAGEYDPKEGELRKDRHGRVFLVFANRSAIYVADIIGKYSDKSTKVELSKLPRFTINEGGSIITKKERG